MEFNFGQLLHPGFMSSVQAFKATVRQHRPQAQPYEFCCSCGRHICTSASLARVGISKTFNANRFLRSSRSQGPQPGWPVSHERNVHHSCATATFLEALDSENTNGNVVLLDLLRACGNIPNEASVKEVTAGTCSAPVGQLAAVRHQLGVRIKDGRLYGRHWVLAAANNPFLERGHTLLSHQGRCDLRRIKVTWYRNQHDVAATSREEELQLELNPPKM